MAGNATTFGDRVTVLGLIGAALLFLGAFSPILSAPIVGSQTYIQNGSGQGLIIIALAVLAVFFVLTRKYKLLWLPGIFSLATIAYSYLSFRTELDDASENIPFAEIREAAREAIQLQWGWAVLVLGALAICGAAALAREPTTLP